MPETPVPHILPFDELLTELRLQGFAIGVDSHIRLNRFLNRWHEGEEKDLTRLRTQLSTILAHTKADQERFCQHFDRFVERHTYEPPSATTSAGKNKYLYAGWFAIGALLVTLIVLMAYVYTQRGVDARFAWQQQAHTLDLWLEDESEVFTFPILWNDSVRSRKWIINDSILPDTGKRVKFTAPNPGIYTVNLLVQSRVGQDTLTQQRLSLRNPFQRANWTLKQVEEKQVELRVNPIRKTDDRILPLTFYDSLQGNAALNQFLSQKETAFREQYRSTQTYDWDLGDGTQQKGDSVSHVYGSYDNYEIQLLLTRRIIDSQTGQLFRVYKDSYTKTAFVEQDTSEVDIEPVPIPVLDLEEEDISDLLKPQRSPSWPYWVTLLLILLYGLYEAYLRLTRKLVLDSSPERGPPMDIELQVERPDISLFQADSFEATALRLRERQRGEAEELDLGKSLEKTIYHGGLPILTWRKRLQASQYLFLIDEHSHEDQWATYFAEWVEELQGRDISAEAYFYDRDPSICWKYRAEPDTEVELERLAANYGNYRLIVLGEGGTLLDPFTGKLTEESQLFQSWRLRILLTPRPTEVWNQQERQLNRLFPLLPATPAGLVALADVWEEEQEAPDLKGWARTAPDPPAPPLTGPFWLPELRAYLGKKGFQWLCACAIYPELYWEFTLRFGQQLGLLNVEGKPMAPQAGKTLLRLLRLPWFREGRIPRHIRGELARRIDPVLAWEVRQYLIAVLEQPQNQAPEHSYARQQQETTLAIYQYLNSEQDDASLDQLRDELEKVSPHSIRDVVSLQSVSQIKGNALGIPLPRSFFRGGIPLYGTQWRTRLLLFLIPLVLFWGSLVLLRPQVFEPPPQPEPYTLSGLDVATAKDSARWHIYEGIQQAARNNWEAAATSFQLAARQDTTNAKALFNQEKARFRLAQLAYQDRKYQAAAVAFGSCCPQTLPLEGRYAAGAAHLYGQQDSLAIGQLLQVGLDFYRDSLSLFGQLAPPQQRELTKQLRSIYRSQPLYTKSNIRTLLTWMGDDLGEVSKMLDVADSLFQRGDWQAALAQYENVLLAEPGNEMALQQRDSCWANIQAAAQSSLDADLVNKQQAEANNTESKGSFKAEPSDSVEEGDSTKNDTSEITKPPFEEVPKANTKPHLVPNRYAEMIFIPAGTYEIGSKKGTKDEQPPHIVRLEGFYIGKYEVTQNLWEAVMGNKPSRAKTCPLCPVVNVSWEEVQDFIQQLNERTQQNYRLPTEAEWESAARGGNKKGGYRYAGSNRLNKVGWHQRNSQGRLHEVGTKDPNELGIYDMSGNVWEWCQDWSAPYSPSALLQTAPTGPKTGINRVIRGGSYDYEASYSQVYRRSALVPTGNGPSIGFRLALTVTRESALAEIARNMVEIKGGTFDMGSNDVEDKEQPVHAVTLENFYLSRYEVTQAQWRAVMGGNPSRANSDCPNCPVDNISWNDAQKFIQQLNQLTGLNYRLPTEAQWEYAARGGNRPHGFTYAGSENLDKVGWYYGNSGSKTHVVGTKGKHNGLGIYDMSGNVWEWCQDWYGEYPSGPLKDPKGPESGVGRVLRGGSWGNYASYCRVVNRNYDRPDYRHDDVGFRLSRP